ncbi:MAG TPA: aminotransferase class III-fold pyridoxal phosphate-dependent enzyme, partial [Longimicrobium sp.]|nr:aminotransferase class III-fold pyridoxal phosphate-dependent enzyme [Longimicrobium sp.]
ARFRRAWKEILYPIASQRAQGSRIWDLDGNEYVDIAMGYGCNLFGHVPDFITRAIREQAEQGFALGPQSPDAGRAAELVCELGGVERAVFCNSGTEAVMGAVRAARALTGRSKVAMFAGSYHGWADLVMGRVFSADGRREVRPSAPGVAALPLGDVLMLDFDEPASLELLARELDDVALVMVEPVQSRRFDVQAFAFLRELRRMTSEAGALLHFDELITGFRVGPGGAQAHFGIQADLVTYGKVVAGGLPMGVVAGTREAMSVFDGGLWNYGDDSYPTGQRTLFAGAYFKHPLSMAVTRAVMEEIRRQGPPMYERLNERTTRLVERMNAFFEAGRYPITAVHFASCFRFYFGAEVVFPDLFNHHMILEGIYVLPETGTHFLSTAHTDDDLERVFRAVRAAAEAMRRGGLIPTPPGAGPGPGGGTGLAAAGTAPAAGAEAGPRVLPLTEGQRQLWLETQMDADGALAYVESTTARLRGALEVDALRDALRALVERHDTLRMTFGPGGDVQLVHPPREVQVGWADFRGVDADERGAQVEAWVRGAVRRPFDLVAGPLVRFDLAAVAQDEHLLVFTAHHAVFDGWSFGVLWKDLAAFYAAARERRPAMLPPAPDHEAAVRALEASRAEDPAAEAFWLEQFADGVPVLELPTDRPRPPVRGYAGERATRPVGTELTRRLSDAGRGQGMNMFHTLLSSLLVWLGRVSGQEDLVVGTPSSGQAASAGASQLVGYGINVLPIRVRLNPASTFAQHARLVRRTVLHALDHQNFSMLRLVEKVLRGRDPSRPPLFSVLMDVDRAEGEGRLGDLRATFESNFGGGAKVDLSFAITETGGGLHLACDYATSLFDHETIEHWLASFERLLENIAANPDARLDELALAGPAEAERVLNEWNRTEHPYPHACIHELFEAQARATPGAVAVAYEGGELTFAELDARGNQLAHHLRRRGIGPEDRVALCLERGPLLLPAFLGVLKAGAAYVPLDPGHPPARLAYVLRDSGARLLLTQSWLAGRLPEERPETVFLDDAAGALAREPADRPETGVTPENLAYVYYTSGSTGRPKGVAMHHYGPANYFAWGVGAYHAAEGRGAPVFSSMAVDLTLANFI